MLRSIGKQSGESVESDRKKQRKATVGKIWVICRLPEYCTSIWSPYSVGTIKRVESVQLRRNYLT